MRGPAAGFATRRPDQFGVAGRLLPAAGAHRRAFATVPPWLQARFFPAPMPVPPHSLFPARLRQLVSLLGPAAHQRAVATAPLLCAPSLHGRFSPPLLPAPIVSPLPQRWRLEFPVGPWLNLRWHLPQSFGGRANPTIHWWSWRWTRC